VVQQKLVRDTFCLSNTIDLIPYSIEKIIVIKEEYTLKRRNLLRGFLLSILTFILGWIIKKESDNTILHQDSFGEVTGKNTSGTNQIKLLTEQLADIRKKNKQIISVDEYDNLKVSIPGGYDWQPAIQQAINDTISNGGGFVLFSMQEYKIRKPIVIPAGTRGLKLIGVPKKSVINNVGTGDAIRILGQDIDGLEDNYVQYVMLSGLRIVGNLASGHAIFAQYATKQIRYEELDIETHGGDGIHLENCWGTAIDTCNIQSVNTCVYGYKSQGGSIQRSWLTVTRSHILSLIQCHGFTVDGGNIIGNTSENQIIIDYCLGMTIQGNNGKL